MHNHIKNLLQLCLLLIVLCQLGCSKTSTSLPMDSEKVKEPERSYYWYRGEKVTIFNTPGKKYILYTPANEEEVHEYLAEKKIRIVVKSSRVNLSASIQATSSPEPLKWAVVETDEVVTGDGSKIIYEAPFFTSESGDEFGLTHLFYVKLNNASDFEKLKETAETNRVAILGNNEDMPLWYTLQCSNQSVGNALEMANAFYETGTYASSQPDLMSADNINGANDAF